MSDIDKAAMSLANSVGGLMAFEYGLRALIGNTNFNVLMLHREECLAAIVKSNPSCKKDAK